MRLGRLAFAGAVLLALAYFALRAPVPVADARFLKQEFFALGTLVSVSLYLDEGVPRERGHSLIADLERFLAEFESHRRPHGPGALGRLNAALADGQPVAVPAADAALFVRAEEARRRSGGLFDARLGALVRLWGFHDEAQLRTAPPPADAVQRLATALAQAPAFVDGTPYGPVADLRWDFGGIAKGAAVEAAMARLKAAGVGNAIVNAGGNLRSAGMRGRAPWRIGIRHPRRPPPQDVMAYLLTQTDEAVMTSGDYERYFEHAGQRYHHLLDPRTGAPARGLQSVTVVHDDAAWADAASTAVFVAGPEGWRATAASMGITQALVVTDGGELVVTEALHARLKYLHGQDARVVP